MAYSGLIVKSISTPNKECNLTPPPFAQVLPQHVVDELNSLYDEVDLLTKRVKDLQNKNKKVHNENKILRDENQKYTYKNRILSEQNEKHNNTISHFWGWK